MRVRHEDKETCEEEGDEQVSLSFVIPSDSQSIMYVCVVEHLVCMCLGAFTSPFAFVFSSCSTNPKTRCTQTVDIFPIHRQISLFSEMMVVPTQRFTLTVALEGAGKDIFSPFFVIRDVNPH